MPYYKILWKSSAKKEIRKLPKKSILKIIEKVDMLVKNPFPSGVKKLIGSDHSYRLRIGNYRVVYNVYKEDIVIEIIKIGHRRDIYQ